MLYACDHTWWRQYFPEIATGFHGSEMWTIAAGARDQYKISWIYGTAKAGLSNAKDHIHTGLNSGYQAISLAVLFGAARILLLGYDFQRTAGKSHWHGDHPRHLGNGGRMADWVREMTPLAADARARGIQIINCSRKTALHCFAEMPLRDALPDGA